MSRYDLFEYENSADTYIRVEEQRRKEKLEREAQTAKIQQDRSDKFRSETRPQLWEPPSDDGPVYGVENTREQYQYNKETFFKNIKEPDFGKLEVVKGTKPKASFGTQLMMMNATPLPREMKVYKYKSIDQETGSEIVTGQKEITVYGENEHNFYYLTKDGIQSVAKNECSMQKLDKADLEKMFQDQMNKVAKKMVQTGMATFKPGSEATKNLSPLGKFRKDVRDFEEQVGTVKKEAGEMVKTGAASFWDKITAPLQWAGDRITETAGQETYAQEPEYYEPMEVQLKDGKPDQKALKKLDEKNKMVKEITPGKRVKMLFGSVVEVLDKALEGQKGLTTAGKMEKITKKKKGLSLKEEPYKREYNYPPGFSKETDAMMAKKSKEEIAKAREEDKKRFINTMLGRPVDTELDTSESVAQVAGEMGAMITEIIITHKMVSKANVKGVMKRVMDSVTSGSVIGLMDKLKERDAGAIDTIRNMAKEAAFFLAGGEAAEKVGKLVPGGKSLGKKLLGEGAKSIGFGVGGVLGSTPFKEEKESLGDTVKEAAYMAAIDAGFKILSKGPGSLSKILKGKKVKSAPVETVKKIPGKKKLAPEPKVKESKVPKGKKPIRTEGEAIISQGKKVKPKATGKKPTRTEAQKTRIMTDAEIKQSGILSVTDEKVFNAKGKKITKGTVKKGTDFRKHYELDTPIKSIPKDKLPQEANRRYNKLVNDIGENIIKKHGTGNPRTILNAYNKKYNLTTGKITIKKTLSGDNRFARIEWRDDGITMLLNPEKSKPEQIAAMRHEIEHQLDKIAGFTKTPGKVSPKAGTIGEYMERPGHHSKYKNFEIEYLEQMYKDESVSGVQEQIAKIEKRLGQKTPLSKKKLAQLNEEKIRLQNTLASSKEMSGYGDTGTQGQGSPVNREITKAVNLPDYISQKKTLGQRVKDKFTSGYTNWVNSREALDSMGKRVKYTSQNYSKYHATAEHTVTKGMVGRDGRPIGKSVKDVILSPAQEEFDSYLFHLNHMAGLKLGKPVLGNAEGKALSGEETKKAIADYERRFPEFKTKVKEVKQFFQDFGQEWLVDGGLLTQKEFDSMRFLNMNYVPKYREVEKVMSLAKGLHIAGAGKGIKKSVGGVDKLKKLSESVPQYVEGVIRAQRRNMIHQELVNTVLENPNGMLKYAQLVDASKITNKTLKGKIESMMETGSLDDKVMALSETLIEDAAVKGRFAIAFEKGKPFILKINDESLWKGLKTMHKTEASGIEVMLDSINKNFSNKVKGMITYYNPLFPIGNVARDIPQAYVAGSNHNPITYTTNLFRAFGNVMKQTMSELPGPLKVGKGSSNELFQKYMGLGGPGANITKIEKGLAKGKWQKSVDTIFSALNWFGSVTETVPRLAEFKYVMEKGIKKGNYGEALIQEALYKSGDVTVNFSRGGTIAKQTDKLIIYTNAGIQGIDKFTRTMITEGVAKGNFAPILKAFGVMTVPSLALHWMSSNIFDQDEYRAIPDYVKDNNYVVPVGDKTWLKIPKNREAAFIFSTTFERMLRYIEGDKEAFKGYSKAAVQATLSPVTDFLEGGVIQPLTNIINGGNKDYFGNPIEPEYMRGKRSKRYISKETTSYLSQKAGPVLELMNLSPAQADYLIDSWTGWIGDIYMSFNERNKDIEPIQRAIDISHRVYRETGQKATTEYYDTMEKLTKEINDYEITSGIKEYKDELREQGYSTSEITEKVQLHMSGDYGYLEELKEKRKQMEKDWKGEQ